MTPPEFPEPLRWSADVESDDRKTAPQSVSQDE